MGSAHFTDIISIRRARYILGLCPHSGRWEMKGVAMHLFIYLLLENSNEKSFQFVVPNSQIIELEDDLNSI